MTGMPLDPSDALGQDVTLECLGGPCDGEWLTHDRRVLTCTRPSFSGGGRVTSLYRTSVHFTSRGLRWVWLYTGDR